MALIDKDRSLERAIYNQNLRWIQSMTSRQKLLERRRFSQQILSRSEHPVSLYLNVGEDNHQETRGRLPNNTIQTERKTHE